MVELGHVIIMIGRIGSCDYHLPVLYRLLPLRETSYPRLAQMIVDYDVPVKKFSEDSGAISQVCLWGVGWGWGHITGMSVGGGVGPYHRYVCVGWVPVWGVCGGCMCVHVCGGVGVCV